MLNISAGLLSPLQNTLELCLLRKRLKKKCEHLKLSLKIQNNVQQIIGKSDQHLAILWATFQPLEEYNDSISQ